MPPQDERSRDEQPLLELRDVVKHYRTGGELVRAVDGVSLSIYPGELVALFGPSGSGKSTLLMLAAAVLQPDSGAVLANGRDVSALTPTGAARYRMQELGLVTQSIDLQDGATTVDNAAMKLFGTAISVREAQRRVTPLLEALGLGGRRLRQRADLLSMGERQRVTIAQALSLDPTILLADEPTGSLDSQRTREVLEILRNMTLERGMATLLVTHDAHAVEFADRVYTLEDGVLTESHVADALP